MKKITGAVAILLMLSGCGAVEDSLGNSFYGDSVFYGHSNPPTNQPFAYHLHEVDVKATHPFASFNEVFAARNLTLNTATEFKAVAIAQIQQNYNSYLAGEIVEDRARNEFNKKAALDYEASEKIFNSQGIVTGFAARVAFMFQAPAGGEIKVIIGGMKQGTDELYLQVGETIGYLAGYGNRYQLTQDDQSTELHYHSMGQLGSLLGNSVPINNEEPSELVFWDDDKAMYDALTVALNQLTYGL